MRKSLKAQTRHVKIHLKTIYPSIYKFSFFFFFYRFMMQHFHMNMFKTVTYIVLVNDWSSKYVMNAENMKPRSPRQITIVGFEFKA